MSQFLEADLPLRALPHSDLRKGANIVIRIPYYSAESGAMIDEYWYGEIGLMTKGAGHWVKFYDVEDGWFISEEKHEFKLADYYDKWMLVEKVETSEIDFFA